MEVKFNPLYNLTVTSVRPLLVLSLSIRTRLLALSGVVRGHILHSQGELHS